MRRLHELSSSFQSPHCEHSLHDFHAAQDDECEEEEVLGETGADDEPDARTLQAGTRDALPGSLRQAEGEEREEGRHARTLHDVQTQEERGLQVAHPPLQPQGAQCLGPLEHDDEGHHEHWTGLASHDAQLVEPHSETVEGEVEATGRGEIDFSGYHQRARADAD